MSRYVRCESWPDMLIAHRSQQCNKHGFYRLLSIIKKKDHQKGKKKCQLHALFFVGERAEFPEQRAVGSLILTHALRGHLLDVQRQTSGAMHLCPDESNEEPARHSKGNSSLPEPLAPSVEDAGTTLLHFRGRFEHCRRHLSRTLISDLVQT